MRGKDRYYYLRKVTPAWADRNKINALVRLSKKKGINWQVDHIVPLIHPEVCGLHTGDNLSIIRAVENRHKSNHHWPDMWNEQLGLELNDCRGYQCELSI